MYYSNNFREYNTSLEVRSLNVKRPVWEKYSLNVSAVVIKAE